MDFTGVDTEWLRLAEPEAFEALFAGRVRPYWMQAAREVQGLTRSDLEDVFGVAASQVEAGAFYPPWTFLCRYAAWADVELSGLVGVPAPRVPFAKGTDLILRPLEGEPESEALERETVMRVRYHPAVVRHTMSHLGDRYGVAWFGGFADSMSKANLAASRAAGTQIAAGVTISEIIGDLDAGRDPDTRILRAQWACELTPFQELAVDPRAVVDGNMSFQAVSWMDPSIHLTFGATTKVDRRGTRAMQISIVGRDAQRNPMRLPHGEIDLWVPVLFDDTQLPYVTLRGAHKTADSPATEFLTFVNTKDDRLGR